MADMLGSVQQQLNEFWQGLENGQKFKLISVVVLCTLIAVVGVYLLSKPTYEVLFPRLEMTDLGNAKTKLTELKISSKYTEDGFGIMVPAKDLNDAKVQLAQAGIPKGKVTYADALSGKTQLGTTQSDKDRQFIAYKAQEISSALMQNSDNISDVTVMLNIPESSSFLGDQKKSTASVKITPSGDLSSNQVEGIARFVANSVEGLEPKNVEVVDNNNKILSQVDDTATGGADRQYLLEQLVKRNKEKEIQDLIANQSSEFDDARVIANLKLDFNSEIVGKKIIEPVIDGTGAIVSKSEKSEELINGDNGATPGTDANTGTATTYPNSTSSSGSSYKNTDNVTNYAWNESTVQQNKALGQVDKNNSSIAISLYYGKKTETAPTQEVKDRVINIVSKATGLTSDKISVESFKIAKEIIPQKSAIPDVMNYVKEYGTIGAAAILLLLLSFAVFAGPKKYQIGDITSDYKFNIKHEKTVEEIELDEKSEVKKQIDKFVKQKPEAVANLLRNWLAEDWE